MAGGNTEVWSCGVIKDASMITEGLPAQRTAQTTRWLYKRCNRRANVHYQQPKTPSDRTFFLDVVKNCYVGIVYICALCAVEIMKYHVHIVCRNRVVFVIFACDCVAFVCDYDKGLITQV